MRLPSFNDFSPGIFGDIRQPLEAVAASSGDKPAIISGISKLNGWAIENKRAKNVLITLKNTGLYDGAVFKLTALGYSSRQKTSALHAAQEFCAHILQNMNGHVLIEAERNLMQRGVASSKANLKSELIRLGITDLNTATTDHTTLQKWLVEADVLEKSGQNYKVKDAVLKNLTGISAAETAALAELDVTQRLFLLKVRRLTLSDKASDLPASRIISECLREYPGRFDEDQMRKKVIQPLEKAGWISSSKLTAGRGAKSGLLRAEQKLLDVPDKEIIPDFNETVPPDLRARLNTSLEEIKKLLHSSSKNDRGLGLELLTLRIVLDLNLVPKGFRKRAQSTGFAEVDVVAEGQNLIFSRWMFQCKSVKENSNVDTEDVAREVGIAVHARAHVICMVSTGGFTSTALKFAQEVTADTYMQFLFIDRKLVHAYLDQGVRPLFDHIDQNASEIMRRKATQLERTLEAVKSGSSEPI